MITVQEAQKMGIKVAGSEPLPDFIFTAKVDNKSNKNIQYQRIIRNAINEKLSLKNYSSHQVKHLTYVFIIFDDKPETTSHPERKFYKRSAKHFFMDIRIPDYQGFCNADEQTALRILSEQTLRGTEKFLSKVKDFDYQRFSSNLKEVLKAYLDIKA